MTTAAVQQNGSFQSHDKHYCEFCKRSVQEKNYLRHCSCKTHISRMNKAEARMVNNTSIDHTRETMFCNACNKSVRLCNKKRHDRSKVHKANWKSSRYLVKAGTLVPGYQSFDVRVNCCQNIDSQYWFSDPWITEAILENHLINEPDVMKLELNVRKGLATKQYYTKCVHVRNEYELQYVIVDIFTYIKDEIDVDGLQFDKIESQYIHIGYK